MTKLAQQTEFLSWKIIPARLDAGHTAWFLGFMPHEIPILVAAGMLKPLGHPARNSTKFFATETLEQLRRDEKWLARASDAIAGYWRARNARKQSPRGRAPSVNAGLNRRSDPAVPAGSAPAKAAAIG